MLAEINVDVSGKTYLKIDYDKNEIRPFTLELTIGNFVQKIKLTSPEVENLFYEASHALMESDKLDADEAIKKVLDGQ